MVNDNHLLNNYLECALSSAKISRAFLKHLQPWMLLFTVGGLKEGDEGLLEHETDLDDFELMNEVDENQMTVKSNFSINTQDSAHYQQAPLQCGNIRFVKDTIDAVADVSCSYHYSILQEILNFPVYFGSISFIGAIQTTFISIWKVVQVMSP